MSEEEKKEIESYVNRHGLTTGDDYYRYHMSMGFYYMYYIDALQYADMIDGGEVFDEYEVSSVLQMLNVAKKTYLYYRSLLVIEIPNFDLHETVYFQDSAIEGGVIRGNKANTVKTARKWVERFIKKGEPEFKEGLSERMKISVSRDFFLYEVAVFILYLAKEEVNYRFLCKR